MGTDLNGARNTSQLAYRKLVCMYIVTVQKPTTIVPFFGDQPFWGERVQQAGVGPAPILASAFTLEQLVDAINFMMQSQVNDQ